MPGLPDAGADPGGRQWGNVALGVVCLLLLAALRRSWRRREVQCLVVALNVVAALAIGLGAVTALLVLVGVVSPAGPEPPLVAHLAVVAGPWVWTVAWLLAAYGAWPSGAVDRDRGAT